MKSKILFLGAKKVGYECLKYILSIRRHLGIELVGVVPGTPRSQALNSGYNIYDLCNQYSIQVFNGIPTDIETDFIISVQYHKILTAQQIHQAKRLAIKFDPNTVT
ncbi:MAG: hypothetical protein M1486_04470, partial [Gammaproteobacteria bacterium]|nr:hypothetical protein [Gammaproteobacteria bacterium]